MITHLMMECINPECSLRFPIAPGRENPQVCPRCGWQIQMMQEYPTARVEQTLLPQNTQVIDALLDNIRSSFNVGAMFRTADGAGLRRLHLCGLTPSPAQNGVAKTALGAEQAVSWVYYQDCRQAAEDLVKTGAVLWALEGGKESLPILSALPMAARLKTSLVLVVGNEVSGVDPSVLNLCEQRIAIPMHGMKDSLNVSIAFGIAAYFLRFAREISGI